MQDMAPTARMGNALPPLPFRVSSTDLGQVFRGLLLEQGDMPLLAAKKARSDVRKGESGFGHRIKKSPPPDCRDPALTATARALGPGHNRRLGRSAALSNGCNAGVPLPRGRARYCARIQLVPGIGKFDHVGDGARVPPIVSCMLMH